MIAYILNNPITAMALVALATAAGAIGGYCRRRRSQCRAGSAAPRILAELMATLTVFTHLAGALILLALLAGLLATLAGPSP